MRLSLLERTDLTCYLGDYRITFDRFWQAPYGLGAFTAEHNLKTKSLVVGQQGNTNANDIGKLKKLVIMRAQDHVDVAHRVRFVR